MLHAAHSAQALGRPPPLPLQADAAAAVQPPPGSLKLGARRKLVVLRAPRLGAQQLSADDAVAATLAYRPGCLAAVDLQQLQLPPCDVDAGSRAQQLAGQPATMRNSSDLHQQRLDAAAPAARAAPGEPLQDAGSQQARGSEDEGGGLSAYISSWFGSPTKQAKPAFQPAAAVGSAGQPVQSPPPQPQDDAASQPGAPSRGASPARPATADNRAQAPASGSAAGLASAIEGLVAQLEEHLAPVLPSVGVVHLGLELAGAAGLVMRWQQQLQAVAEPSE